MELKLERTVKRHIPPFLILLIKRIGVYFRYFHQAWKCQTRFKELKVCYPHKVLFVAGLPKSGTTWLEKMLASYPGFHSLLIPESTTYELRNGGSHDYDLPVNVFSRFQDMLVVTKMHICGSPHNARLLHEAGMKYVILYRDLRDVAVSYHFYVRQTPWHPEYPVYKGLSIEEGLTTFADRLLIPYADWVRSWHQNRDPGMSLVVRYEEMLTDTAGILTRVAEHFELDSSPETIHDIVEAHSFKNLSGGRRQGKEGTNSFFRKGKSGDWRNHFTPGIKETYKELIGDFLIDFGYEEDYSW
jgi:hypothetical protein